ncbi:phage portal protein [Acidovorax sp. JG5]|uniref:phage portal protein n=1 Tax=Acidovorax sp. JG5 TaxID=2822718 RepID=UPI001B33EF62|nr:phage portal protein [Acidovorax sp. JG5]MBP3980866.1 phage portal protein [Acidovorax sp. JG5]
MAKRTRRPQSLAAAMPSAGASMAGSYQSAGQDLATLDWNPVAASADADLLPDLQTLTARSRDLSRNNGLMGGAMQTMRDNIVGSVLRLSCTPDYRLLGWEREYAREWGNLVEAKFRSWGETTECDASRSLNLLGMTLQALGGAMLNGDSLALPLWLPRAGTRWNTRIMTMEADRLSTPVGMEHRADIRGGIEFDTYGAPVAYHILKRHPGDAYGLFGAYGARMLEWDRVPAFTAWGRQRVIHLHDKERTGQSRGRPIVSAVMREFHMAGKYASNELEASLANSLVAAFLESDLDPESAGALFGQDPRAAWGQSVQQAQHIRKMKGAAIIPLPVGARVSSFTPGRPNQAFEAFMLASLRHIAAGMNLPYELLLKDFSKTSWSSARASLLEAWRYFHGRRRWLTDYWLRPIYELWFEEAVNAGEIEAPGFYQNKYAYLRARFIFGGRGWVDPVKEAQAAVIRMNAGLSTLEKECAEQGDDYEEVLDQRALERDMKLARGLPLSEDAASAAALTAATAGGDDEDSAAPAGAPQQQGDR